MASIFVSKADVPCYLQKGFFAESWVDCPEKVEIDIAVCKETDVIENALQLEHLLMSLRFWIVEEPPATLLDFVLMKEAPVDVKVVLQRFSHDFVYIAALVVLHDVKLADRWKCAIENDYLFCVRHMHDNSDRNNSTNFSANSANSANSAQLCYLAAASGSFDCLRYFHEQGYPWDEKVCGVAAKEGKLDCLQYLHQQGCPWDVDTCDLSAEHGHAECLFYAASNKCPIQLKAVALAIEKGHINCLKELVRCRMLLQRRRSRNIWRAAAAGQLEVLKYFVSMGTSVSDDNLNTVRAARGGHLDCLKYLHEVGCPWNVFTTRVAADEGHLACLRYAVEHGCQWNKNLYKGTNSDVVDYFDSLLSGTESVAL